MYWIDFGYIYLFTGMSIRSSLLGGLFGAVYGTLLFPITGTVTGLFCGAVVGLGLGMGNGLLLVLISLLYAKTPRLQNYMQVCTLLTTIFSLLWGIVGFGSLLNSRSMWSNVTYFLEIPTLIAAAITVWLTQGLTIDIEKRKRNQKGKVSYDNRPNEKLEETANTLAQVLGHNYDHQRTTTIR